MTTKQQSAREEAVSLFAEVFGGRIRCRGIYAQTTRRCSQKTRIGFLTCTAHKRQEDKIKINGPEWSEE